VRALILEHNTNNNFYYAATRLKTENKKTFRTDREKARTRRGIFLFAEEERGEREEFLNFFFFGQNAEKTNAETHVREEKREMRLWMVFRFFLETRHHSHQQYIIIIIIFIESITSSPARSAPRLPRNNNTKNNTIIIARTTHFEF
jgi:hypothetical protein